MKTYIDVPHIFSADEPVYIVGGGKSLDDFDFGLLAGKQVIALNKAMFVVKDAAIGFMADARFYGWHKDASGEDFWRFKGRHILTTADIEVHERSRIKHIAIKEGTFSKDPAYIESPLPPRNTGWQAINLAYLAGGMDIVLLGYDCTVGQFHADKSYAHKANVAPSAYHRYADQFTELAKFIKKSKASIKIRNANPASAIDAWEKCTIEEVLTK